MQAGLAIGDKRRDKPNEAHIMHIIGDVSNRNAIIFDDIIDTAGTLIETVNALKKNGAKKIYAACTHGVLSGQAIERINQSDNLEKVYVSDTIPLLAKQELSKKIESLSVAKLFADAIESIHNETSVSKLFL
jgi:ribose-phosphate pyrophosphokinase